VKQGARRKAVLEGEFVSGILGLSRERNQQRVDDIVMRSDPHKVWDSSGASGVNRASTKRVRLIDPSAPWARKVNCAARFRGADTLPLQDAIHPVDACNRG
jgi:hypothetical protein